MTEFAASAEDANTDKPAAMANGETDARRYLTDLFMVPSFMGQLVYTTYLPHQR